ncbi:MAG TPA: hypothetical protein VIL86_19330 [Tepidisphaeraceae bacterium]|jgi:hypothetical protein
MGPSNGRRASRITLAVALLAVGITLLVGCLYIPTPEKLYSGPDFRKQVGKENSNKPIRVGVSRDDIERLLGKPPYSREQGRVVGYVMETINGYSIWPLCAMAMPEYKLRMLRLEYDEHGFVQSADVLKGQAYSTEHDEFVKADRLPSPATRVGVPTTAPWRD